MRKIVNSSQSTPLRQGFAGRAIHSKAQTVNREPITVNHSGQILVLAIIFLAVVIILVSSLFTKVAGFLRFGANSILREQATSLAEAGIDNAVWQLNKTAGNCPTPYCGTEQAVGTTGSFIATIQDKSPTLKTITSTGYIPNNSSVRAKRTIKVDVIIDTFGTSFRYAVQTLEGGVIMANSSTINGTVYSNGDILAGVGSGQSVNGDAYAVGVIDEEPLGPIDVVGITVEGASPQPAPTIDQQPFKDAAESGGTTICTSTCTINADGNIGPQKYIGNLAITNNSQVTLKGPLWITGNFTTSQGNTVLKLDEGFGSQGTGIVVDGNVDLTQGGSLLPTSAKGYIMVISNSTASDAVQISQAGATAIFYVLQGTGILSQTAHVAALVAYRLQMSQSAVLDYDTGLASVEFTAGPGGSWQIKRGTYKFTASP